MQWSENIKGLQHIGIPTNDMSKTVEFYKKIGFENILETTDGYTQVVFLKLKDIILETYENGKAVMKDGAIDHIAMDVKDIDEAYSFIAGLGIRIISEIAQLPFWENGVKFFIAEGPNQERLEFAQYL